MKDSFDRDVYLDNRPDVKAAIDDGHFTNTWHHYAAFGQYEGTANADQEAARRHRNTANSDRGVGFLPIARPHPTEATMRLKSQ